MWCGVDKLSFNQNVRIRFCSESQIVKLKTVSNCSLIEVKDLFSLIMTKLE